MKLVKKLNNRNPDICNIINERLIPGNNQINLEI